MNLADARPGQTSGRATRRAAPGRPRDGRIDRAVHEATLALLDESGYLALSIEAVARRARVSRPAVYRRWPSKAALVVDALGAVAGTDPVPDTGSLRGDLLALTCSMAATYDTPAARRVVPGLLADLAHQPELAEQFLGAYVEPRRASTRRAFARAVERGEIPPVADLEVVCDLLAGPLLLRAFVLGRPTDEATAAAIVDAVVACVGGPPPRPNHC
jgi:AcrR family transcriptional regulator